MQTAVKTHRRSVYVRNLSILSALAFLGCIVKEAKNDVPPLVHQVPPTPNYVVGTFEGTFSIDKTRVVAAKETTGLVVAQVGESGKPAWMRSFSGLPKGYAVVHAVIPGSGVVVLGISSGGSIAFDRPNQVIKAPDGKSVLFVALVSEHGRVISAAPVVTAGKLSSPEITRERGEISVSVPYDGEADIQGVRQPAGNGKTLLKFNVTRDVKIINGMVIKADLESNPVGKKAAYARAASGPGLRLASMMMAACNICSYDEPMNDSNCDPCANTVSQGDSWCRSTGWDRYCMDEAFAECPSSMRRCDCPHNTCATGILLHPLCNGGSFTSCMQSIDAGDTFCQWSSWDSVCVADNSPMCGTRCP